jgi:hypothetical protein
VRTPRRELFLKWALLNALFAVLLVTLAVAYGGRVHGPSLVAAPLILAVYAYAASFAGRICWRGESPRPFEREKLLHEMRYLPYWAWVVQMLGIVSTVLGFWLLLSKGGGDQDLHDRILSGGGVALVGTFVGILTSLVITATHRMIEHDLER